MNTLTIFDVIRSGDYLVLDTETTGLGSGSEICQIAIIDSTGKVLLNTLVKPVRPIPAEATAIHGITDEMVKDAIPFSILATQVYDLLKDRHVVIYNADYDVRMLNQNTDRWITIDWYRVAMFYCAMEAFAQIYGDWNPRFNSYRWQKLSTACAYYKVKAIDAHSALGDCLATLEVCKAMAVKQQLIEDDKS